MQSLRAEAEDQAKWAHHYLTRAERAEAESRDTDGTSWKTVCGWWAKKYDAADKQQYENLCRAVAAEEALARFEASARDAQTIGSPQSK
jgi:hypothetical protein